MFKHTLSDGKGLLTTGGSLLGWPERGLQILLLDEHEADKPGNKTRKISKFKIGKNRAKKTKTKPYPQSDILRIFIYDSDIWPLV